MSEDSDPPDFSPIDPIWRKYVLDPRDARAQRTGVGPFHPHLVDLLRRRVGSDGLLIEAGLDWIGQRLPGRLPKAEAVSERFVRVTFERLVLDFLNHQFGKHEPPKGVLAKGGVWLVAFRLICHQRLDSQSVIGNLTTNHGLDQLDAMRVIRETLYLSRNTDCGGQRKGRSVSINADEGGTLEHELRDEAEPLAALQGDERAEILRAQQQRLQLSDAQVKEALKLCAETTRTREDQAKVDSLLLFLHFDCGLGYAEISRQTTINARTVERRIKEAVEPVIHELRKRFDLKRD